MNVFISWSGEKSLHIAEGLRDWLPDVLPDAEPWMSAKDIDRGTQWRSEIRGQLDDTSIGIICLTPDNLTAPWLLFESGALSKNEGRVFTYLHGLSPSDVEEPLSQYQHTLASKGESFRLVMDINKMADEPREEERVTRAFDKFWPDLETRLNSVPSSDDSAEPPRSEADILREILGLVRNLPELDGMIKRLNVQPFSQEGLSFEPYNVPSRSQSTQLFALERIMQHMSQTSTLTPAMAREFLKLSRDISQRRYEDTQQSGLPTPDTQPQDNAETPKSPQSPSP